MKTKTLFQSAFFSKSNSQNPSIGSTWSWLGILLLLSSASQIVEARTFPVLPYCDETEMSISVENKTKHDHHLWILRKSNSEEMEITVKAKTQLELKVSELKASGSLLKLDPKKQFLNSQDLLSPLHRSAFMLRTSEPSSNSTFDSRIGELPVHLVCTPTQATNQKSHRHSDGRKLNQNSAPENNLLFGLPEIMTPHVYFDLNQIKTRQNLKPHNLQLHNLQLHLVNLAYSENKIEIWAESETSKDILLKSIISTEPLIDLTLSLDAMASENHVQEKLIKLKIRGQLRLGAWLSESNNQIHPSNFDLPAPWRPKSGKSYFLLSTRHSNFPESFVAAIDDPKLIHEARQQILDPTLEKIMVANISKGNDGTNRAFNEPFASPYSWSVSEVLEFNDFALIDCDGSPSLIEENLEQRIATNVGICFWSYRIVKELPSQ